MNNWTQCVIDASMSRDGLFSVCPIEGDIAGEFTVITGMNHLENKPNGMKLVAIVHPDGQAAVDEFCKLWKTELDKFTNIN